MKSKWKKIFCFIWGRNKNQTLIYAIELISKNKKISEIYQMKILDVPNSNRINSHLSKVFWILWAVKI